MSRAAKAAGGKVSITLSDPFCIERHRDEFRRMVREDIDLLFANEHELMSLYQTDDLRAAMDAARADTATTACTVGPKGAHVATAEGVLDVPAAPMPRVDATGAGDLFAAGFLFGLTHGRTLAECGRMGCLSAGAVIGHIGARPQQDLKALFAAEGLL